MRLSIDLKLSKPAYIDGSDLHMTSYSPEMVRLGVEGKVLQTRFPALSVFVSEQENRLVDHKSTDASQACPLKRHRIHTSKTTDWLQTCVVRHNLYDDYDGSETLSLFGETPKVNALKFYVPLDSEGFLALRRQCWSRLLTYS
jgi:hypothetical protein